MGYKCCCGSHIIETSQCESTVINDNSKSKEINNEKISDSTKNVPIHYYDDTSTKTDQPKNLLQKEKGKNIKNKKKQKNERKNSKEERQNKENEILEKEINTIITEIDIELKKECNCEWDANLSSDSREKAIKTIINDIDEKKNNLNKKIDNLNRKCLKIELDKIIDENLKAKLKKLKKEASIKCDETKKALDNLNDKKSQVSEKKYLAEREERTRTDKKIY